MEALVPCSKSDSCHTQVLKMPALPIIASPFEGRYGTAASVGLPIFFHDKVLGEPLGMTEISFRDRYGESFAHYVSQFLDIGTSRPFVPEHKSIDQLSMAIAHKCAKYCRRIEQCDSIQTQIDIPFDKIRMLHNFYQAGEGRSRLFQDVVSNEYKNDRVLRNIIDKLVFTDERPLFNLGMSIDREDHTNLIVESFHPLSLNATCTFHKMSELILVTGQHADCDKAPTLCQMKVGQIIQLDSLQRLEI